MSMGAYDDDEHERRERKNNNVDTSDEDTRAQYHGEVAYDGDESTEELLNQFKEINS